MACYIPPNPPNTAPLTTVPPDAHAYAEAFRAQSQAEGRPLGYYVREVHDGMRLVKQYTQHTISNGVPGCYNACTLFLDTSPPGSPPDVIDWRSVALTGAAAVAVVSGFLLMLHHAGRPRRNRRR